MEYYRIMEYFPISIFSSLSEKNIYIIMTAILIADGMVICETDFDGMVFLSRRLKQLFFKGALQKFATDLTMLAEMTANNIYQEALSSFESKSAQVLNQTPTHDCFSQSSPTTEICGGKSRSEENGSSLSPPPFPSPHITPAENSFLIPTNLFPIHGFTPSPVPKQHSSAYEISAIPSPVSTIISVPDKNTIEVTTQGLAIRYHLSDLCRCLLPRPAAD
ncbi:hypothetical protein OROMI_005747 [Orobanche minor]